MACFEKVREDDRPGQGPPDDWRAYAQMLERTIKLVRACWACKRQDVCGYTLRKECEENAHRFFEYKFEAPLVLEKGNTEK